jgi:hypothetical protein
MEKWRSACDNAERKGMDHPVMSNMPKYPSSKEIIEKAKELNDFVSRVA